MNRARSTVEIVLSAPYPQILYWMCMHFFGPVPQEALDFYTQPAMAERQFSMMYCPVGTGPYRFMSWTRGRRAGTATGSRLIWAPGAWAASSRPSTPASTVRWP